MSSRGNKILAVRLAPPQRDVLDRLAAERGETVSDVVRRILARALPVDGEGAAA